MHWYESLPLSVPVVTHTKQALTCRSSSGFFTLFGLCQCQQKSDITSATRKVPCVSPPLDTDLRCSLCAHLDIQMIQVIPFPFYRNSILPTAVVIRCSWQSLNHFFSYRFRKIFQQCMKVAISKTFAAERLCMWSFFCTGSSFWVFPWMTRPIISSRIFLCKICFQLIWII